MSSSDTRMMNQPVTQTKMVKIKAVYPIRTKDAKGHEVVTTEGNVVEVSEEEAKDFCDREYDLGMRNVFGDTSAMGIKHHKAKRAVRVG